MGFTWESAICVKTKIAADGETSLDDVSAKICNIFGFEKPRQAPRRSNSTSRQNEK